MSKYRNTGKNSLSPLGINNGFLLFSQEGRSTRSDCRGGKKILVGCDDFHLTKIRSPSDKILPHFRVQQFSVQQKLEILQDFHSF